MNSAKEPRDQIMTWDDTTMSWSRRGSMLQKRIYHAVSIIDVDRATMDNCVSYTALCHPT